MSSFVNLKTKNGTIYVYESTGHWDKEKKMCICKRRCVGKRNPDNGEIVFSKKYLAEHSREKHPKQGSVSETKYRRYFAGAIHLLDSIGEKIGITADLKICFPYTYKKILSLAYYLVLEGGIPIYRFPKWAFSHDHPYGSNIPSQRSSELFSSIKEDAKQAFFRKQGKRRAEKEYLAYDTTSISSYSNSLKQVKYGKNKDCDPLPQINLALLFGEESGLPFYYRKYAGNITDVKTIQGFLRDINFINMGKVKLVMDRGFYSADNINAMYRQHLEFLIGGKLSLKLIKVKLEEVRGSIVKRSNYSSAHNVYTYSCMMDWKYSETKNPNGEVMLDNRRIYLHLYFNDQKALDDRKSFNRMLDMLEEELLSSRRNPKHEKQYLKYYEIHETLKGGLSIVPKQDAIDETEKNYGYFALLSNGIRDPLEALEIYRTKDMIEKAFGNLKERLNMRRTSVASEENLEGKLFVQFVALIYLSYIKKIMVENNLFKNYTIQELMDNLDIIEKFEQPGFKHYFGEITKKQMGLYECFGVSAPSLI